jgi:hypothetical protein
MAQYQRGLLGLLDNIGHRKRFARARNAQKCLERIAVVYALNQLPDGLGLIAGWEVLGS